MKKIYACICLLFFWNSTIKAQYTVNGNAFRENCNCYTLTNNQLGQSGSVWNNNRIDLSQSFDFTFEVFLGCNDAGADGIAFVLQPISTIVGSSGGGMGFQGINPSLGVTLDTYQNSTPDGDPSYDHIAIQLNGDVVHTTANAITPLTPISATSNNVEDCQSHLLKIVWDAPSTTMTIFFDGVQRLSVTRNLVATVFGGNTQVFWGFTGATGGLSNLQKFCTILQPKFVFLPNQKRCLGEPITFIDSTLSFSGILKRYWNFGDGSPIDSVNTNPSHTYSTAGNYTVTLTVLAIDGCVNTFNQTVSVGSKPLAGFLMNSANNCVGTSITLTDTSSVTVGTISGWYWELDNNGLTASIRDPSTTYTTGGLKNIRLVVKTIEGCVSDTLYQTIQIHDRPVVDFTFSDSVCVGTPTLFFGTSSSSQYPVTNWLWSVGDTSTSPIITQNAAYTFSAAGLYNVALGANSNGSAGCLGTITKNVFVTSKPIPAIKNVLTCQNSTVRLLDSSYTVGGIPITGWWWDLGNGQFSTDQNPLVTYSNAGPVTVRLAVRNSRGCLSDTLSFTINVGAKPLAAFTIGTSLCNNNNLSFTDASTVTGATIQQWQWIYNSTVFSTQQNSSYNFPIGNNRVGLVVTSSVGCVSDSLFQSFLVKTKPAIQMFFKDTCRYSVVNMSAIETSTFGIVTWHWNFGDGTTAIGNPVSHVYNNNGIYNVSMYAISVQGCSSDTIRGNINIYGTNAFAGNDTIAAPNQPIQLNATGGLSYQWFPGTGLNNNNIPDPIATLGNDQTYYLRAFTPEGCESFDTLKIIIYKGPEIYVPGAFTPNGDGNNDVLRTRPVGIQTFEYFIVYNRYGQVIFRSSDPQRGWDGRVQGKEQNTGTYVWMAAGVDFLGNKIFRKGTVMLIR
jgi:gliding motility-associated-like protein